MDDNDDNYEIVEGLGPQDPDPDRVAVSASAFINPDASNSSEEIGELSSGKIAETDIPVQRREKRERPVEDDEDGDDDPFDEFLERLSKQKEQTKQGSSGQRKVGNKGLTPEQIAAIASLMQGEGQQQQQPRRQPQGGPSKQKKALANLLFDELLSRHDNDDEAGAAEDMDEGI
jgi:hypothetical protein